MHRESRGSPVSLYSDGACSGNPGPGGWAAILRHGAAEKRLSGCEPKTTNNRMELMAVIRGLEALTRPCRVTIETDSSYVVKGMTEWMTSWRRSGWKSSSGKPVLNRDLWERLCVATERHQVTWTWIKGHDGHPENEECDRLARGAIRECLDDPAI